MVTRRVPVSAGARVPGSALTTPHPVGYPVPNFEAGVQLYVYATRDTVSAQPAHSPQPASRNGIDGRHTEAAVAAAAVAQGTGRIVHRETCEG